MQIIRLVKPGNVDRVIAFDSLPERLLVGIRSRSIEGLPREWRTTATQFYNSDGKETYKGHYYLEYKDVTRDIEKWEEIVSFVRRVVDPSVRLMDRVETMSIAMAPDAKSGVSIDPESIQVIPIPIEYQEKAIVKKKAELENSDEPPKIIVPSAEHMMDNAPKRRGRPKRVAVA